MKRTCDTLNSSFIENNASAKKQRVFAVFNNRSHTLPLHTHDKMNWSLHTHDKMDWSLHTHDEMDWESIHLLSKAQPNTINTGAIIPYCDRKYFLNRFQ